MRNSRLVLISALAVPIAVSIAKPLVRKVGKLIERSGQFLQDVSKEESKPEYTADVAAEETVEAAQASQPETAESEAEPETVQPAPEPEIDPASETAPKTTRPRASTAKPKTAKPKTTPKTKTTPKSKQAEG